MRKQYSIGLVLFVIMICFLWSADPEFYIKKSTWQETMFASRVALIASEQTADIRLEMPDFDTSDFSVILWIKTTDESGVIFSSIPPDGAEQGQPSALLAGNNLSYFTNGSVAITTATKVNDNTWHCLGLTGRSSLTLYVDGDKKSEVPFDVPINPSIPPPTIKLGMGGDNWPSYLGFEGKIDNVQIYNRKLSSEEVKDIYENRQGINNGLVGHWNFEDEANDISENTNHGKIHGANLIDDDYGKACSFDGQNHVSLPKPNQAIENRYQIWNFILRDFPDEQSKKEMRSEREDEIWDKDWTLGDVKDLAGRYVKATRDIAGLTEKAKNILPTVQNSDDILGMRDLYQLSITAQDYYDTASKKVKDMRKEINSLEIHQNPKNQRWIDYKNESSNLTEDCEKALSMLADGDLEAIERLERNITELNSLNSEIPYKLPSGPKTPGRFGAYYTQLNYYSEWDNWWRFGRSADIVVRFEDGGHKFIFWRGTNYIPHWVTENGIWYNNEFLETWTPETRASCEPMSDKQCRFSHVRVIESNEARAVIHWRYALADVQNRIAFPDEETGWGDWADEYYVIYPDAIGVREAVLYSSILSTTGESPLHGAIGNDLGHEWHEGIIVYNVNSRPEESLEIDAVHVANMKGETGIWSWEKHGDPVTPTPEGSNIVLMNVKSDTKPFVISHEGCNLRPYRGSQGGSHFRWRDHWPTTREPTPGRNATGEQAAHGSFFHMRNIPIYQREGEKVSKILLHGLTDESINNLVPIAQSWLNPPEITFAEEDYNHEGFDPAQRAYIFSHKKTSTPSILRLQIDANKDSPVFNPAFVIKNWGDWVVKLKINGKKLKDKNSFRVGHRYVFDRSDLIVWIRKESTEPIEIHMSSD